MRIGLIGYGKMGQAIEKIALERGHTLTLKCDSKNKVSAEKLKTVDVAIEFSTPSTVLSNLDILINSNTPTVVGTTGWNNQLDEITQKVAKHNSGLVHASNFSIGVNLFFKLNQYLASLMQSHKEYSAEIEEIHHTQKLDAPSGTAITLAEGILAKNKHYSSIYCLENDEDATENGLQIKAIRTPDVPGTHTINYTSEIDTLTIEHTAHKRTGFALGAVVAAEWIVDKQGVYTMQDVLKF